MDGPLAKLYQKIDYKHGTNLGGLQTGMWHSTAMKYTCRKLIGLSLHSSNSGNSNLMNLWSIVEHNCKQWSIIQNITQMHNSLAAQLI